MSNLVLWLKLGCIICAAYAQAWWDSLNWLQQWIAAAAGMCLLYAFAWWVAGKIGRWRGARKPAMLIEQHEGFDAWHQALCGRTRQKFSVEEAYEMWRRKLYEHEDLTLLYYPAVPVAKPSEEE